MGRPPESNNCANCGTPLFSQWWSRSKGGYECRRCGAVTQGTEPPASPGLVLGCAFVGLGAIAAIAWLATMAAFYLAPLDDLPSGEVVTLWLAVAIGTTWVAYRLSRKLWPSSESTGSEGHSWRKPGRWRLVYAVPWLAIAVLYFLTFGGVMTLQDYLDSIPWVLVPALFPAVGFLLIRPRFGLWVVALLGLPIAAWLFLLVSLGEYRSLPLGQVSQVAQRGLFIAVLAALLASLIAVVVLARRKWIDEIMGGLSGGGFG